MNPETLNVMETWPFKGLKIVTDIADVPGSVEYVRIDIVDALRKRLETLEKENKALRANTSKSVLRRLESQAALAGEK